MKRNVLNSPRLTELKKHRQRAILNKILISLLALAVIFAFLAYLSRLSSLQINNIEVTGNKVIDTQAIEQNVNSQLAGKYFWLFPKSNILIYPENEIKDVLQNKFARLKDISLSVENDKILKISLAERTAAYTWCGEAPDSDVGRLNSGRPTSESCYFLDADGYIFDLAPYFSGEVYFKFYGIWDGRGGPVGSYFSKSEFIQLIYFKNILEDMGLKPISIFIDPEENADIQIFLSPGEKSSTTPKILINKNADLENVAENLQAALNTEPLKSKFKKNYSKLQYIDLRFGNKVYDKFQ